MSLKVKDISKHLFKNGKTDNHYHVNIKGKDINYIIINTLRRICLQLIPVHAFHPEDVEISVNTSVYNNDIIRLRLSNFPIYGMENNNSQLGWPLKTCNFDIAMLVNYKVQMFELPLRMGLKIYVSTRRRRSGFLEMIMIAGRVEGSSSSSASFRR